MHNFGHPRCTLELDREADASNCGSVYLYLLAPAISSCPIAPVPFYLLSD